MKHPQYGSLYTITCNFFYIRKVTAVPMQGGCLLKFTKSNLYTIFTPTALISLSELIHSQNNLQNTHTRTVIYMLAAIARPERRRSHRRQTICLTVRTHATHSRDCQFNPQIRDLLLKPSTHTHTPD